MIELAVFGQNRMFVRSPVQTCQRFIANFTFATPLACTGVAMNLQKVSLDFAAIDDVTVEIDSVCLKSNVAFLVANFPCIIV
jgi:hypothetical protein